MLRGFLAVIAVLAVGGGIFLVGAYVAGVIEVIVDDAPDKSWLYWGLGLAFLGMALLGAGLAMGWWSWRLHKASRDEASDGDAKQLDD